MKKAAKKRKKGTVDRSESFDEFLARDGLLAETVHRSEHRPTQRAVHVHPLRIIGEDEARQFGVAHLGHDVGLHLTRHDGVSGIGSFECVDDRRPGHSQQGRQLRRHSLGIGDHRGIDGDQLGGHRHHERLTVAVEDGSPQLVQRERALSRLESESAVRVRVDDPDPQDPSDEHESERHDPQYGKYETPRDPDAEPRGPRRPTNLS